MSDDTQESESDIELREAVSFGSEQAASEAGDADIPPHAARLIVSRATDLLQTVTNIQLIDESEGSDDVPEEQVRDSIEEDVVDLLLAIGSLDYEYDLRIADTFEKRKTFIEDFKEYEDAIQDIESQEEAIEIFDEYMSEHADENPHVAPDTAIEPGDNVDDEDYDPDNPDRGIA